MKIKSFSLLAFVIIPILTLAQKSLFDTLVIDSSTKIIGRYPHNDKTRKYESLNFIIEDSLSIKRFIEKLEIGKVVENSIEIPGFKLTVVKNRKEIGTRTINPSLGSAMTHDGHTYAFEVESIRNFSDRFPFSYLKEKVVFNTNRAYMEYLARQVQNPLFLFDYAPSFRFEGSFEIEFKKSREFSNPSVISEFLKPLIEKIVDESEYQLYYTMSEKNLMDMAQVTMTIEGPKMLFEHLKIKGLKNENWKSNEADGMFFYRKF